LEPGIEEAVPQFIGGYSVQARLSNHKSTAVFRAYDGNKRRDVCIKMLTVVGARSATSRRWMQREVELGRRFSHPGLCEIYDYVTSQPRHFFVMEYFAPGATLADTHLSQPPASPPFSPPPLRPMLIQLLETLSYIHKAGVVHRDIKPDNVLVNELGQTKIIDFSVAFDKPHPWWKKMLGFRQKVVGTRTYMAPEQIEGRDVDGRADLYSFGAMMFELIAGRPPFTADSADALLRRHLTEPPVLLHTVVKDVVPEISQLINRMLSKEPPKRPSKAEEVLYYLKRHKLRQSDPDMAGDSGTGKVRRNDSTSGRIIRPGETHP
jgi:serine/threonine protein kinase